MGIWKEFRLALIQAYYANGKSRNITEKFLVHHTEWSKGAKNRDIRQISRVMKIFEIPYDLMREKPQVEHGLLTRIT